ncbi:MAG: hypothetical protein HKN01_05315, partial [Acidimicrobiia bacterium]|nr:hypothetical protein [Acidimicrobiia bacterium]
ASEGGLAGLLVDGIMGDIYELIQGSSDRWEIRFLFKAWFELWASSYSRLWIDDGNALHMRFGDRVFRYHAKAVGELQKAEVRGGSAADAVPGVIAQIVFIDQTLAEMQLAEAYAAGASPDRIAKAEAALADAYASLADDRPDDAIEHFRTAWREATWGIQRR